MSADTISVTNGGSVTETGGSSGPSPPASPQELQAALTVTSVGGVTYTGAGIKVGVLSTSFNRTGGAATDTADGALPPASQVTVLQDAPSDIVGTGADDEGREHLLAQIDQAIQLGPHGGPLEDGGREIVVDPPLHPSRHRRRKRPGFCQRHFGAAASRLQRDRR